MLFEDEYEKLGEAEVRKQLLLSVNSDSHFLKDAPAWLAAKAEERAARTEARADSAIAISRLQADAAERAAVAAERASRYAMYAAAIAITAALVTSKDEIFALIFDL